MTEQDTPSADAVAEDSEDFVDLDAFLGDVSDTEKQPPVEEAWQSRQRELMRWQLLCAGFGGINWWDSVSGALRRATDALDVVPEERWPRFRDQAGADDHAFLRLLSEEAALITRLADQLAAEKIAETSAPPEPGEAVGSGILVCPALPSKSTADKKIADEFAAISGKRLPLACAADPGAARAQLRGEFPWAIDAIDALLSGTFRKWSAGSAEIDISPTLLVGSPGCGKSRLLRRLGEVLGLGAKAVSVAGAMDDHLFGVSRGWSTGMPSIVLTAINESRVANPLLILDEIDKPLTSQNGNLASRLLPLLERSEARAWRETYLNVPLDVSRVNWTFTANDLAGVPEALRSRLRVVRVPQPTAEHVPALVRQIRAELADEREIDPRWYPGFDPAVIEMLRKQVAQHGSVRVLKRQVEALLDGVTLARC